MRRAIKGFCVSLSLACSLAIFAPIDWCTFEWVRDSPFWWAYFNCGDHEGGGGSGAS